MDTKTDTKSSLRILEDWSLCDACPDADMVSNRFRHTIARNPTPLGILHDSNHLAGNPLLGLGSHTEILRRRTPEAPSAFGAIRERSL
jgi:hypothetical protein